MFDYKEEGREQARLTSGNLTIKEKVPIPARKGIIIKTINLMKQNNIKKGINSNKIQLSI